MRTIGKLSAAKVAALVRAREKGLTADGGGLYLQISTYGTASWIFRYRVRGAASGHDAGLGSLATFSLAEARERARKMRQLVADGIDPIDQARAARQAQRLDTAKAMTFAQCADRYIEAHSGTWKSDVHRKQWSSTLRDHVHPTIGDLPVQAVDTRLVLKVLEPIWTTKPETASRVRGRIESILDWAKVSGHRTGENPALWRGHLDNLLPKTSMAKKAVLRRKGRDGHHAALAYPEMAGFMSALRAQGGVAARALEFTILTAARTGEVIAATWDEIDLAAKLWTVPAERMKAGREHRVPLSARAVEILAEMASLRQGQHVFSGAKAGKPLSNMAMLQLLRRMERADITAHGFRSTFRDWAAERTAFPSEVAEMALAHSVGDKVEAAYRRGDLFEKRRQLMDAWATFCNAPKIEGDVTPIRGAA